MSQSTFQDDLIEARTLLKSRKFAESLPSLQKCMANQEQIKARPPREQNGIKLDLASAYIGCSQYEQPLEILLPIEKDFQEETRSSRLHKLDRSEQGRVYHLLAETYLLAGQLDLAEGNIWRATSRRHRPSGPYNEVNWNPYLYYETIVLLADVRFAQGKNVKDHIGGGDGYKVPEEYYPLGDEIRQIKEQRPRHEEAWKWMDKHNVEPFNRATMNKAMFEAVVDGRIDVMALIIRMGVKVGLRNSKLETLLHVAVKAGQPTTVQFLLDNHANIAAGNSIGQTPLHTAAGSSQPEILTLLIASTSNPIQGQQLDIDIRDDDGKTPLAIAASSGDERSMKILIKAGANINARERLGDTVLDVASRKKWSSGVKMLHSHGAVSSGKHADHGRQS